MLVTSIFKIRGKKKLRSHGSVNEPPAVKARGPAVRSSVGTEVPGVFGHMCNASPGPG